MGEYLGADVEWWSLIEGAVRSLGVVVVDVVGDELFELTLVPDDGLGPVGWAVIPAKMTSRVLMAMKNSR